MKPIFLLIVAIMFCSCATSGDTAEAQYQYSTPKQESFRGSTLDAYGGIGKTSNFRYDRERHNRAGYWDSPIPRKYSYWKLQKLDTISNTAKKKTDKKSK